MTKSQQNAESALIAWDVTLDRDEVTSRAHAIAAHLRQVVDGKPVPVSVFAANSGQSILAYLGTVLSGAVLVPTNMHLSEQEFRNLADDLGLAAVVVDAARLPIVRRAVDGMTTPPRILTWDVPDDPAYDRVEDLPSCDLDLAEVTVQPPIMYSSGTTGEPKRVITPPASFPGVVTVEEFLAWAEKLRFFGLGPHLVCGPLYHGGPIQSVWLLAAGTQVIVPRRFDPQEVLETIEQRRIATTLMVPTHFVRLLAFRGQAVREYDVSSVVHITQTGGASTEDTKRRMIDWFGPVILESYGGTESGGITFITSEEWLAHPGSVGRAIPRYRAFAVDEDGNELPRGSQGKLYFEDSTGRGVRFEGAPALTAAAQLRPGVFTLGEIGIVDPEGYVYITDRDSDKVVSGGVNLYPAEIEKVLVTHPAVADAALIGVSDAEMGESLRALVVLRNGGAATESELIDFCRERLSTLKSPRSVLLVDDLGRSPLGKLNRRTLRAQYGAPQAVSGTAR